MQIHQFFKQKHTKFLKRTMALTLALLFVLPSVLYSIKGFSSVKAADEDAYTPATAGTPLMTCFPDENFAKYVYEEVLGHGDFATTNGANHTLTADDVQAIQSCETIDTGHDEQTPDNEKIADLTGIQNFTALTELDVEYNKLQELPELPPSLTKLNIQINEITSLPKLPESLTYLYIGANHGLTPPDPLPSSLTKLYLSSLQLQSLPALPETLTLLDVQMNHLKELPELPESLTTLNVNRNQIKELPELPKSLTWFSAFMNELQCLPALPESLDNLQVEDNQLKELPELPPNLTWFEAYNNQLKELDLSNLYNPYIVRVYGQEPEFEYIVTEDGNYKILDVPTKNLSDIMINDTAYNSYDNSGFITVSTLPTSFTYNYNTGYNDTLMDVTAQSFAQTTFNEAAISPEASNKTEYKQGETFDPNGLVLDFKYASGTTVEIEYNTHTKDKFTFSPSLDTQLSPDDNTITITYEDETFTQTIKVASKALTSIDVETAPKTDYIEGQKFNPEGLILELIYNDGAVDYVTYEESNAKDFTFTPSLDDTIEIGDNTVTIEYGSQTVDLDITVSKKALDSISISKPPDKTAYIEGNKFDPTGLEITLHYDNGTNEVVKYSDSNKESFIFTPGLNTLLKTTDETVRIEYQGAAVNQTITVVPKTLTRIEVETAPKTDYIEGQYFNPEGLAITLYYDNGTNEVVKYSESNAKDFTFTPRLDEPLQIGENIQVTIQYKNQAVNQTITVVPKALARIEVATDPKTDYIEGQKFNPEGLRLKLIYNDGAVDYVTYEESNATDFTFTPTLIQMGNNTVTIRYGGISVDLDITVSEKELDSISISKPPDKTAYIEGNNFDPTGLEITLNYDNGTNEVVTYDESTKDDFKFDPDLDELLQMGDDTVRIEYKKQAVSQQIDVYPDEIQSIKIQIHPNTDYKQGETFDPTGLEITVDYGNDITETVEYNSATKDKFTFTPSLGTPLSPDNNTITITYAGKDFTQKITIDEIESIKIQTPPNTDYKQGETFDPTGLEITVDYGNGITETVKYNSKTKDKFTFTPELGTPLFPGKNVITITYAGEKFTQEITIDEAPGSEYTYSTITSDDKQVTISGYFLGDLKLVITELPESNEQYPTLLEALGGGKKVLLAVDVSIENGTYKPGDNLTLTFKVDPIYNGKTATIKHLLSSGQMDTSTATIIDGKVQITVTELSPFMIAIDEDTSPSDDNNNQNGNNNSNNNSQNGNQSGNGNYNDSNNYNNDYDADPDKHNNDSFYQTGSSAPILALFSIILSSVAVVLAFMVSNRKKFLQK